MDDTRNYMDNGQLQLYLTALTSRHGMVSEQQASIVVDTGGLAGRHMCKVAADVYAEAERPLTPESVI